jgi:lysozyme family protein
MNNEDRFNHAVSVLLSQEGGFSDDKDDPGGITKYGVSVKWLMSVKEDINEDGVVNSEDIKNLTRNEAIELYREYWWDKYCYNDIEDLDVATKMLSLSVNMGPSRAHRILQQSINRLNEKPIKIDGIIGINTLNSANDLPGHDLLEELKINAAHFYVNLIWDNRKLEKYLLGWMRRAFH